MFTSYFHTFHNLLTSKLRQRMSNRISTDNDKSPFNLHYYKNPRLFHCIIAEPPKTSQNYRFIVSCSFSSTRNAFAANLLAFISSPGLHISYVDCYFLFLFLNIVTRAPNFATLREIDTRIENVSHRISSCSKMVWMLIGIECRRFVSFVTLRLKNNIEN